VHFFRQGFVLEPGLGPTTPTSGYPR